MPEHDVDAQAAIERVTRWAQRRDDVRGVALVGSYARGEARADSDVDIVLLTETPGAYVETDGWVVELGAERLVRTRRWGVLTERRIALPGSLEIDVGVTTPAWARTEPLDKGTREVALNGFRPLYDPDGLLAALARAL